MQPAKIDLNKKHFFVIVFLIVLITGTSVLWWMNSQTTPAISSSTKNFPDITNVNQDRISLSPQEEAYLAQLGNVTICVDPDWEPYEYINEMGEYEGIAADLVRLIAKRSGVNLELIPTKDWDESINISKEGECMALPFLTQTPARDEWLLFTEPYFTDPNVFVTRVEHDFISDPASLINHSIALPSGTSVEERIRKDYPGLTIINAGSSEADTFSMVEERKADMTLRSLTMAAYTIRKEGLFNLKIAGQIPDYSNEFRIGVTKKQPVLRDILNRGISTITPQEVQIIVNRHISIEVKTDIDYYLIIRIIIGFSILAAFGLLYLFQQRRLNRELTTREEKLFHLSNELRDNLTKEIVLQEQLLSANEELKTRDEELQSQLERIVKSERYLRESEEKYRYMTEHSSDAIWHMDTDYRFTYISPADERVRGFTQQEVLGTTVWSLLKPEGILHVKQMNAERLREEKEGISTGTIRYELEQKCKGGSWIWTEVTVTAHHDADGVLVGYHGVTRDVSKRKRAEQALKENESKFISIFEETPDPILILNSHNQIIEVNQGFEHVFGCSNREVSGKCPDETGLPDAIADFGADSRIVKPDNVYRKEMTFHTQNGVPFIAEVAVSHIVISSEPCFLIQIHDIDEIRRAHEAIAQVNHKLKILSSITRHDILNRIMVTSMYSEMVREEVQDEKLRKRLEAIGQASKEIQTLIEFTGQYQDLGATSPKWQKIQGIINRQSIQGLAPGITLISDLSGLSIYADPMLEKVVYNLVENSVRHGKDLTHISVTCQEERDNMVLYYEDDGGGISIDEKEKAFEKGFGKNTGLGLFLIREILSITSITITETGDPGVGVRFEIHVPAGKWRMEKE